MTPAAGPARPREHVNGERERAGVLFDLDGEVKIAPAMVMTAHYGHNAEMIAHVARMYVPDGATVIDATWGKGGFWHRTDTSRFQLVGMDLETPGAALHADFRQMPFADGCADVVTLDPPYVHATTQPRNIDATYRNRQTGGKRYADTLALYVAGMDEASRVLKPGGTCWVKCQDAVEGCRQQWAVISVHRLAEQLDYEAQDMFVLVNPHPPGRRHAERQFHARRNHSYLWIFRKRARA